MVEPMTWMAVYMIKIMFLSQPISVTHAGNLSGHRGAVYCMTPWAQNNVFYTSGGDGWIVAWPATGEVADGHLIAETGTKIFAMDIHPENIFLVAGDINGHMYWIDLHEKEITGRVVWHTKSVFALAFTPYGLLSAAGDGILCLWDGAMRRPMMSVQLSAQGLRSMAFDAKSGRVYVGSSDQHIYIWNVAAWSLEETIRHAHTNSVFSLLVTEEGRLLSGGRDAQLGIWDTSSLENIQKLPAHWYTINKIISMGGTPFVATASRDKTIRIWLRETLQPLVTLNAIQGGHVHSVNSLLWLQDKRVLVSSGDDKIIRLWSVE